MARIPKGRIARWTERKGSRPHEWTVVYREYRNGIIYQYRGKGNDRAMARRDVAGKFFDDWGEFPSGYVEPTA